MPVGLQLGIQQLPVNRKLEAPTIRWYQGDRLDIRLKFLQQFGCQTDSTISVVSDCTVDQIDLQCHNNASINYLMNTPAGDATGVKKPASHIRYRIEKQYLLPC
jgi:hypothetical protein